MAVELNQEKIVDYLMLPENFPDLDIYCKDAIEGDIPLHAAVRTGNHRLVQRLYDLKPESCLAPNFKGQTPVFVAT